MGHILSFLRRRTNKVPCEGNQRSTEESQCYLHQLETVEHLCKIFLLHVIELFSSKGGSIPWGRMLLKIMLEREKMLVASIYLSLFPTMFSFLYKASTIFESHVFCSLEVLSSCKYLGLYSPTNLYNNFYSPRIADLNVILNECLSG